MENSNIVRIEIKEATAVYASHADVFVTVTGTSFYTGDQGALKTKEVNQLVQKLSDKGILREDVRLDAVSAKVEKGLLSSASSARYSLRIRCSDLNKISEIVGVVTSLKSAAVERIAWCYGDVEKTERELLTSALRKARERGALVAQALGTRIIGVRECTTKSKPPEIETFQRTRSAAPVRAIGPQTSEELGLELAHASSLEVEVLVRFLVDGFET